jgi:hypothetical protein
VRTVQERRGAIYVDTMISPSMASALAQSLQMPGVSGMDNNTILFEYGVHDPAGALDEVATGLRMAGSTRMNRLVLRHGDNFFGARKSIHVWLTGHDARNANLMILLTYIILGHPDWHGAEVSIFAAFPRAETQERTEELNEMIAEGRLLISEKNVLVIATDDGIDYERLVEARSATADLVVHGFTHAQLQRKGPALFERVPSLRDVLFVSAEEDIDID